MDEEPRKVSKVSKWRARLLIEKTVVRFHLPQCRKLGKIVHPSLFTPLCSPHFVHPTLFTPLCSPQFVHPTLFTPVCSPHFVHPTLPVSLFTPLSSPHFACVFVHPTFPVSFGRDCKHRCSFCRVSVPQCLAPGR